jgi:hypothetical protein
LVSRYNFLLFTFYLKHNTEYKEIKFIEEVSENLGNDGTKEFIDRRFKGRWKRKMRGVGKNTVSQVLSGIVAIEGYLQFERAVSL